MGHKGLDHACEVEQGAEGFELGRKAEALLEVAWLKGMAQASPEATYPSGS